MYEQTILCYFNILLIILGKYTPQVARQRKRWCREVVIWKWLFFLVISYHMLSQVVLTTFFVCCCYVDVVIVCLFQCLLNIFPSDLLQERQLGCKYLMN